MKIFLSFFLLLISFTGRCEAGYWQQYIDYNITVELNSKDKTLTGFETMVYKNYSPDTLHFIWFHLYPNAYKNQTTSLFEQLRNDPKKNAGNGPLTGGSISALSFTVNGLPAHLEPHPNLQYIDVVKLMLPHALPPGDSAMIATPFKVQLPPYFSRSGFEDGEFMVCQWYPKPAVYDKDGWHEMPYLDMGEFYSEYASYKVQIQLSSDFVVGATGVLQTEDELALYKKIGSYNATTRSSYPHWYEPLQKGKKTLTYVADSVPDFAWFADKAFVIEYDTLRLPSGTITDVFAYHHNGANTPWRNSTDYIKDAVKHYSQWVGEYRYPTVQAVEGPKNNSSGGMEYPMITLITAPDAKPLTLDNVITHEIGHNWFMSMLGSNERKHAWMDEGLNTYYEFRYMAQKYRSNAVFGERLPEAFKQMDEETFEAGIYNVLLQLPILSPIDTPSETFKSSEEYSLTVYVKTAEWMYLLERIAGEAEVDSAFQHYFSLWHTKHPQPEDMKHAFEEALNKNLDGFFSLLNKTGQLTAQ